MADVAYEKHAWGDGALAVIVLMLGGKICLNGFRRDGNLDPAEK
jgi:hypothetical protein